MTREEKLELNRSRQKAVRDAWARERTLVLQGKGTVDWTMEQQKELIEHGHVEGYEGQHMKSCAEYPEYAGCVDNIQLLSHEEHLEAHNSSNISEKQGYHSPTNGYYDTKAKTMYSFGEGPPRPPKTIELSSVQYKNRTMEREAGDKQTSKEYSKASTKEVSLNVSKAHALERGA